MSFGTGTLNFGTSSQPSTQLNLGLGKPAQTGLSFGTTASSTLPTSTGIGSGFGLNSLTTNKTTPSFSLGGTTQSGASSSLTPQTGTSSLGLSLASASSTTAAAPTATGVSLTSATPSTSSVLGSSQQTTNSNTSITYKVLEDYINKWMGDLEAQEKDFLNQATQLNALDKLMMDNGEKIIEISNEATRLNNDQEKLEQELNFIFSTQNDLEQAIKKLEMGIEQMPLIPQQTSDTSRIEMYKLLIEVDNQLKSTSIDLKEIIKSLNDTNVNLNDPVVQISKILNAHADSLNWIEENSLNLQKQLEKIDKAMEERNRDTDYNRSKLYFN